MWKLAKTKGGYKRVRCHTEGALRNIQSSPVHSSPTRLYAMSEKSERARGLRLLGGRELGDGLGAFGDGVLRELSAALSAIVLFKSSTLDHN